MLHELSIRELDETYIDENEFININEIYQFFETIVIQAISTQKARDYAAKVLAEQKALQLSKEQYRNFILNRFVEKNNRKFIVDEDNDDIFNLLLDYFTADPEFENRYQEYSLHKGIMLVGGTGTGKTSLLRMFALNPKNTFGVISSRAIADEFASEGGDLIKKWWAPEYQVLLTSNPFGHNSLGVCFDDMGTESEGKYFGNHKNVMGEIILNRYDRYSEFAGRTHLTTNLNAEEISRTYGPRVASRMFEMFNIIVFPGNAKDRRRL